MFFGTAQRAARGAANLDRVDPGWFDRVSLWRMNLASPEWCVLAQLYGRISHAPHGVSTGPRHGFLHSWAFPLSIVEYEFLTWAWRREIRSRRGGDFPPLRLTDEEEAEARRLYDQLLAEIAAGNDWGMHPERDR